MFTLALIFSRLFWKYCGRLLTAQSVREAFVGFSGAKQTSFRLAVRFRSSDQNSMFYKTTQKKHKCVSGLLRAFASTVNISALNPQLLTCMRVCSSSSSIMRSFDIIPLKFCFPNSRES